MSTFIEISPESSTNKITEYIRIDNDFQLTLGVSVDGTLAYHYFNFTGIPDDFTYRPDPADDNLEFAQLVKDGDAESLTIRIKVFYNAADDTLEQHQIPRAWTYGRPIDKDHYLPGELLDTLSQDFPVIIWNTLEDGATQPVAHTANPATTLTFGRQFARLGTVAERRTYLKRKLLARVEDPMLPFIMAGTSTNPIVQSTTTLTRGESSSAPINFSVVDMKEHARRQQGFAYRLEMLARAVSIDSNLEDEAKFNLLDGEVSLENSDVFMRLQPSLNGDIANQAPRTGWRFRRFGSVAASAPFAYTAPTDPTMWATTHDTSIDIGSGAAQGVATNWILWIRE